ncbi:MAG TPA: adenylate/guanylate cyclase domain-containing protein [Candidatus Acidoferrum sp.]|nr:adenylate/guanylate cyclase domain-containing protein [Candidatus Acidoferrum sp.]
MRDMPTGTVTFLFSDIEGSTRLLRELGDGYGAVLKEHHAIVRRAITRAGGVERGTEGDSFFVAFRTAPDAVGAGVEIQRGLAEHAWPSGLPLRVRIGIHTGVGVLSGTDYIGMDVHRAARIAAAAYGGQVVVSAATQELVSDALPPGTRLRDLGEHILKDIIQPEHLYDIVIDGLPADFPPLRTLEARPTNLPLQLTAFIGRDAQLGEAKRLMATTRLLTFTGAGGTGKTRLALQLAAETLPDYADGAFFVDLSPITDPALVPAVIAQALGVPEDPGVAILDTLKRYLREKELLLVLDNFEQVTGAARVVEELLAASARTRVLITSRVVLSLKGEQEYEVPPMDLPDLQRLPDLEGLKRAPAIRLFVDRATAVEPRFRLTNENAPAVAAIATRLDGLPLAIELAASRAKVLSPEQILSRLQESPLLLSSRSPTLPQRQRTLRGAIAWSYDLLAEPERRLFPQISIFRGGWTLEAAESIADLDHSPLDVLDGLSSLLDKSLVRVAVPGQGESRFSMLETIREFAQDRLEASGELAALKQRHGEYFLSRAIDSESHLTGTDQSKWLDYWDTEQDNLRAALRWAVDSGRWQVAQGSSGALWRFWQQRGHLAEGRRWLDEALSEPGVPRPTPARAKALTGAGGIAWWQVDHAAARRYYGEALAIERELGDPARLAEALYNQAFVLGAAGEMEEVTRNLQESVELFRTSGNQHGVARGLTMLVMGDAQAGNWDSAIGKLQESVGIWRRLGDRLQLAFDLIWLAFACGRARRWAEARSSALEALDVFRDSGNPTGIALAFRDLAFIANWEGHPQEALQLAGAAEALRKQLGGGPPPGFGGMLEGDPVAEARQQLPEDVAQRNWDEGLRMGLEDAVVVARRRPG